MMGGAAKGNRYSEEAREARRKARRASFAVVAVGVPANGDTPRQSGYEPRGLDETALPRPQLRRKRFGEGDDLRRYQHEIEGSTAIVRAVMGNTDARRELEESYQKLEVTLAARALVPERAQQGRLELRSKTLELEHRIAEQIDDNAAAAADRQRDRWLADRDYEIAVERRGEQLALAEAARKGAETKATYAERVARAAANAEILEGEAKQEKAQQEIQKMRREAVEPEPVAEPTVADDTAPELAAELKEEERRRRIIKSAKAKEREIMEAAEGDETRLSAEEQEQLDMVRQAKARALRRFDLRQANIILDDEAGDER